MEFIAAQIQNVSGEHLKDILLVLFGLLSVSTPFIVLHMAKRNNKEAGMKCGAQYCEAMPKAECEAQHRKLDERLSRIETQITQLNTRIDGMEDTLRTMPSQVVNTMLQTRELFTK